MTTANKNIVQIWLDGVWAGTGNVDLDDGEITQCSAVLGPTQDESDEVYELISEAIADGAEAGKIRRPEGIYTFDVARGDLFDDGEDDAEDDCCPTCGHPVDGSSGHGGHCDDPCHCA